MSLGIEGLSQGLSQGLSSGLASGLAPGDTVAGGGGPVAGDTRVTPEGNRRVTDTADIRVIG